MAELPIFETTFLRLLTEISTSKNYSFFFYMRNKLVQRPLSEAKLHAECYCPLNFFKNFCLPYQIKIEILSGVLCTLFFFTRSSISI